MTIVTAAEDELMASRQFEDEDDVYHVRSREGLARLRRREIADRHKHLPPNSGNVLEEVFENAVYGGVADPETRHRYQVYDVEWSTPEEARDDLRMNEGIEAQPSESFEDHLNNTFEGWVYNEIAGELYVVDLEDTEESS